MEKRLYRSRTERMIGGVCGGLANYLGTDPTVIRLLWVLLFWAGSPLAYIVAWIIMPEEPVR